VVHHVTGRL